MINLNKYWSCRYLYFGLQ